MSKEIKELHDAILRITQSVVVHTPRYSKFGGYDGENDIYTMDIARVLYHEEKYRKQSEGEWVYNPNGMDWGLGAWECSLCGCNNNSLPMDKNIKPLRWAGAKYCGNCGAKMKGGE